ncbi:chemokine-like receptor 1 [Trachemys scripta elegans]|uniref:chemokine-like receptor 1 n=1 Tax=Trachemys scripta elegans TaxID=31138 RepID=UPI0015523052|nr:chemokine-like receptor 1 [Trachemys scripta elegans]
MEETTTFQLPWAHPTFPYVNSTFRNPYQDGEENGAQRGWIGVLFAILFGLGFLLGVTGNGLVIFITSFRMTKTVVSIWYLNLAVADFIFTSFLSIEVAYAALNFHWPFGQTLCKIHSAVSFLNLFASVFLLTIISIDRCVSVAWPVWAHNHRSPRLAFWVAVAVWLAALALSAPYIIFRDIRSFPLEGDNTICYNNYIPMGNFTSEEVAMLWKHRHQAMVLTSFVAGFLVPLAVILTCYGVMVAKLMRNHLVHSGRPYKIMVAVVTAFFLCWFPYHLSNLLAMSAKGVNPAIQVLLDVALPLAYLNSCLNPALYAFMGWSCKDTLWRSVVLAFQMAFCEAETQVNLRRKSQDSSRSEVELPPL